MDEVIGACRCPFLTEGIPGIGGRIKRYNEDFLVEELSLYEPCGEGTHVYFMVEKESLTTLQTLRRIALALGKPRHDIGFAGLKDAHGITRQWLSVEHAHPHGVADLSLPGIRILAVGRHTNKLKLGHLAGNRFQIRIRDTVDDPLPRAGKIMRVLVDRGLPNYFGPQRFGSRGDNHEIGRAVLLDRFDEVMARILGRPGPYDHGPVRRARQLFDEGDLHGAALAWPRGFHEQRRVAHALARAGGDARRAWRHVDHALRRLYVSAFQSALFNRIVALRLSTLDQVMTGDIAWKHANGACFRVEDAANEQLRCKAFEISPTGPLFGPRMTQASGEPGKMEIEVLADSGITGDRMRAPYLAKISGGRRPLRVPLTHTDLKLGADHHGPYVSVEFTLPAGAYATNVTRELCKNVCAS